MATLGLCVTVFSASFLSHMFGLAFQSSLPFILWPQPGQAWGKSSGGSTALPQQPFPCLHKPLGVASPTLPHAPS